MKNLFGEEEDFTEKNKRKKIFTPLGASNHVDEERQVSDYYATDPNSLVALLETGIEINHKVLEPACGGGHLSEVLIANGYDVTSTDLVYRGYGKGDVDFLYDYTKWDGDIITNPPYKIAQEFVEHSLDIIDEGHKVIMFLKLTFLEGKARHRMFMQNPPVNIYVFSERQLCAKNGDFVRYADGSAVCYAWFEWIKGFKGKPQISWL